MPKEVADALKKQGHWKDEYGAQPMNITPPTRCDAGTSLVIAEAAIIALMLALALALIQSIVPVLGAHWRDAALMNVARSTALAQLAFVLASFAALVTLHVTSDFSRRQCLRELAFAEAADLQDHRRLGQSRGLHDAVGARSWRCSARWSRCSAAICRCRCARLCSRCRPGSRSAFYLLHPADLESVPATAPIRRSRAGTSTRCCRTSASPIHPPMLYLGYVGFSISFSLCHRRADRGPHRRGLGALGAAVDACWRGCFLTLGIAMGSYWAYYELGWGGWWFWDPVENASLDAMARRHRAAALGAGDGKAQRAEGLDHPAVDPDLLAVVARHLPGALGRPDLGARLRQRPHARRLHPRRSFASSSAAASRCSPPARRR